jgi:hypothetical protein
MFPRTMDGARALIGLGNAPGHVQSIQKQAFTIHQDLFRCTLVMQQIHAPSAQTQERVQYFHSRWEFRTRIERCNHQVSVILSPASK